MRRLPPPQWPELNRLHRLAAGLLWVLTFREGSGVKVYSQGELARLEGSFQNMDQTAWKHSVHGPALDFELDDSDHIDTSIDLPTDGLPFTVAILFNNETNTGGYHNKISKYQGGGFRFYTGGSGQVGLFVHTGAASSDSTVGSTTPGTWNAAAATWDRDVAQAWLNGVPGNPGTSLGPGADIKDNAANIYIGASYSTGAPTEFHDGGLILPSMWGRVLCADEMMEQAADPWCYLRPRRVYAVGTPAVVAEPRPVLMGAGY